jgi:hypothetical protein
MTTKPDKIGDQRIRAFLTIYTTMQALLLIVFFGSAPFIRLKVTPDESMGVVELILPLLTGYVGLMLGFYFGSQEDK